MKNWYLVTAKPHKDEEAEKQLNNQGYETYRPLLTRLKKRRGKLVKTIESLFPRYIFIHLEKGKDNWSPIRSTLGVAGFVRFGIEPVEVPKQIIEMLKSNESIYGEQALDLDRFHKGDKVLIEDGPFKGLQAVFEKYDGEERAIVLLDILHKSTQLPIDTVKISSC